METIGLYFLVMYNYIHVLCAYNQWKSYEPRLCSISYNSCVNNNYVRIVNETNTKTSNYTVTKTKKKKLKLKFGLEFKFKNHTMFTLV